MNGLRQGELSKVIVLACRSTVRAFGYAWSLPVRLQKWRSHHLIRSSLKPPAARKLHGTMFNGSGFRSYCRYMFYIAGTGIIDLFCSRDLDLDFVTLI